MSTVDIVLETDGQADEAEIVEWHVAEGDTVTAGQPLVEVAFDKANIDVEAPVSGRLVSIAAIDGDVVEPGAVLGTIEAQT